MQNGGSMKPDVTFHEVEFMVAEMMGHRFPLAYNPILRLIEKANQLGLEGKQIIETMEMEGWDLDRMCGRMDFYFKTVNKFNDMTDHGNGD